MIYLAFALLSWAFVVHVCSIHKRHEVLHRRVQRLQGDVARMSVADQNREAVRSKPRPDRPCPGVNCGAHS